MLGAAPAMAAWSDLNLRVGVTPLSREIYGLHMLILWICVVIGAVVFGVMFYSIFKHRKSVGHEAHQFHENTTVEIVWTIVPFVIVILMAIELILLSVNINLVAFSSFLNDLTGQIFSMFVLTVAASEAAIGLAILVIYFRDRGTIAVEDVNRMKG